MRRRTKLLIAIPLLLVAAGLGIFFFVLPQQVEKAFNGVGNPPPYPVSGPVAALHRSLTVADLHADPLVWGRDLVPRGTRGHVDVPRLIDGNVALQVFSVVTKSPRGLNIERNDGSTDNITLLGLGQRWPPRALMSLKQRALYQAARLHDMALRSDRRLVLVKSKADLRAFLDRRAREPGIVAGLLAIEGAHALEGDPQNANAMFDAGYRMMSFAHFFDSEMAGSAHGVDKGGLTDKGRALLRLMEERRMTVDLAHASAAQIDEVVARATRPVVVSHTGVRGACDNNRNLSDDQLRAIAAKGGLVGIGFWETATCGEDAASIAKAIRYAAALIGADHVALGSDFDGSVKVPFDASGMALLTQALLAGGMAEPDIARVMGGNQIQFLMENLPD